MKGLRYLSVFFYPLLLLVIILFCNSLILGLFSLSKTSNQARNYMDSQASELEYALVEGDILLVQRILWGLEPIGVTLSNFETNIFLKDQKRVFFSGKLDQSQSIFSLGWEQHEQIVRNGLTIGTLRYFPSVFVVFRRSIRDSSNFLISLSIISLFLVASTYWVIIREIKLLGARLPALLNSAHPSDFPISGQVLIPSSFKATVRNLVEDFYKIHLENLQLQKSAVVEKIAKQVAHDIRAPLSALNIAVARIGDHAKETELIKSACRRITGIAEDLLCPKSITLNEDRDANQCSFKDVRQILSEVIAEFEVNNRNTKIYWEDFSDSGRQDVSIRLSGIKFGRIIINLLTNGVEAIEDKCGKIEINSRVEQEELKISVCDNGKGIPQERIATLGTRGLSFGKKNGSGLGLWDAKVAIEQIGGTLTVSSSPSIGTEVTLSLPCAKTLSSNNS